MGVRGVSVKTKNAMKTLNNSILILRSGRRGRKFESCHLDHEKYLKKIYARRLAFKASLRA